MRKELRRPVTMIPEDDAANDLVENIDFPKGSEDNLDSP